MTPSEAPNGTVDVRGVVEGETVPELVPGRLRAPLVHVVDDVLEEAHIRGLAEWFQRNTDRLTTIGEPGNPWGYGWEIPGWEELAPDLAYRVFMAAYKHGGGAEGREATAVPEFNVTGSEVHATMFHHGGRMSWHDGVVDAAGEVVPTRRYGFHLFVQTDPAMFKGGELVPLAGQPIEPRNGRLVTFHPLQVFRVNPVECWSAEALHGRWCLSGWVHGEPPDGWAERLLKFRARVGG